MPYLDDIKVGDKITVIKPRRFGHDDDMEFRTVERRLKTCFVDDSGVKWTLRGDVWGTSDHSVWNRSSWCRKFEDRDVQEREESRRKRALQIKVRRIREFDWDTASEHIVNHVHGFLFGKDSE